MKQLRKQASLRTHLILTIVFFWVLPILMVAGSGSFLLARNYERSMEQELELAGSYAIEETASRFETILFESKTVSYDGVVRSAFRTYQGNGDSAALYRIVSNYLSQRFSRKDPVTAVFLSFWDVKGLMPYMSNQGDDSSRAMLSVYADMERSILSDMADADTKIRLYEKDGSVFVARNLLDSRMQPYATVVIQCNMEYISAPLRSLNLVGPSYAVIDGIRFDSPEGPVPDMDTKHGRSVERCFESDVEGHIISLYSHRDNTSILNVMDELPAIVILVTILVVVLLVSLVRFFSAKVSGPIRTLVEATGRVREGDRGYQITQNANSWEFSTLYQHFNEMSGELKNQFDLAMEEQESLHQARIKALQSQINPHFLNNTLEIINWEARIAENDRITAMIEALATMLNTSLNRADTAQISLRDEMRYTEAYLYIIKQRMGERLQVEYDVDESLYDRMIPRMVLQPIVENAIEHDLSRSSGGRLKITVSSRGNTMILSVEHDGHILPEDRSKLDRLLGDSSEPGDRVHIGVRNVSQRLRLLYGDQAALRIDEVRDNLIRAELRIPVDFI